MLKEGLLSEPIWRWDFMSISLPVGESDESARSGDVKKNINMNKEISGQETRGKQTARRGRFLSCVGTSQRLIISLRLLISCFANSSCFGDSFRTPRIVGCLFYLFTFPDLKNDFIIHSLKVTLSTPVCLVTS